LGDPSKAKNKPAGRRRSSSTAREEAAEREKHAYKTMDYHE
jgi:hypothetical protein